MQIFLFDESVDSLRINIQIKRFFKKLHLHFHSLNENSNHLNQIAGHVKLFIKEAEGNPMKEIKSHK